MVRGTSLFLACALTMPSGWFTRPSYRRPYELFRLEAVLMLRNETGGHGRYIHWDRHKWVKILAKRLDQRDPMTFEHSGRVSGQMVSFGRYLGWSSAQIEDGRDAAWLHDFGKIVIPDGILFKPAKLDAEEMKIMRTHVQEGVRLLNRVPLLQGVARAVQDHHEDWNGGGYPNGKKGAEINVIARALSVVDTYDVITHDRPYKKAKTKRWAFWELRRVAGTQFDPEMVEAYIKFLGGGEPDASEPPEYDPSPDLHQIPKVTPRAMLSSA